jgi:hypothetical protein
LFAINSNGSKKAATERPNLRYPHAFCRLVFAEKIASRSLNALSFVSGPLGLCSYGDDRFFVSSLRRKLRRRPISWALSAASSGQGLPCRFAGVDPIRNRPVGPHRVRPGRAAFLHLPDCFDAAPHPVETKVAETCSLTTFGGKFEAAVIRRSTPDLCIFNRVHREKRCRPDTVVFPYVPSGLRQPRKARIGLTDSSLSPGPETDRRRNGGPL